MIILTIIQQKERVMKDLTVIGIDIAKNYMQIHGSDSQGRPLLTKRLQRDKFLTFMSNISSCLVGMEGCAGAHYWASELTKLGFEAKIMSAKKVKKFVENNKNDAKDAQACAVAVTRADVEFIRIKTQAQLEIQELHRVRSYYVKQKTALTNMMRGFLLEFGIAISKGKGVFNKKINELLNSEASILSSNMKDLLSNLYEDLKHQEKQVEAYTKQIERLADKDELCQKIRTIEGIGPITATALIAKIGNGNEFRKGRELSAYLGLVPKQNSSGETVRLGRISKHGDRYLRQLLIHGGRSSIQAAMRKNKQTDLYIKHDAHSQWMRKLVERVGMNKASVAVANKNARMVVALLKNQTTFQADLAHGLLH
jgi:transposase